MSRAEILLPNGDHLLLLVVPTVGDVVRVVGRGRHTGETGTVVAGRLDPWTLKPARLVRFAGGAEMWKPAHLLRLVPNGGA